MITKLKEYENVEKMIEEEGEHGIKPLDIDEFAKLYNI